MRKISLVAIAILACSVLSEAASPRTLTRNVPIGPIEALELESGIGDVKVIARDGLDEVAIEVTLTPRRGGFFSSMRQAEREVQAASLRAKVTGKKLMLGIDPPADDERRFEERWTIEVPAHIELKLNHGVGDISIQGVRAGLEIDSDAAATTGMSFGTALGNVATTEVYLGMLREQGVKLGMSREEVEGIMGPPQIKEEGDFRGGRFLLYFYRTHNMDYPESDTVRGGYTPFVFQNNRLVGKGRRGYLKAVDRSWSEDVPPPTAPTRGIYEKRTW